MIKGTFLFCRHGESEDNTKGRLCPVVNDAPLTEKGKRQELAWIEIFRNKKVQKVYYSPRQRTKGIGPIVEKELEIFHEVLQDLEERKWGEWGHNPWEDVSEKLEKFSLTERYAFAPPRGESWMQFEERFLSAIDYIKQDMKENKYKTVAIVTHKGSLRAGLPVLCKAGKSKHKDFSMKLGSVTEISLTKDEYILESKNIVPDIN